MTPLEEVMRRLEQSGSAQTRKIFANRGAPDNGFGVKVADLKKIAKTIKGDHPLAMELYATGNPDAMYLAGLVADGARMTKADLNRWARQSSWYMISEYTVPDVAVKHSGCVSLADRWIDARKENVASCGWATWARVVTSHDDSELELSKLASLLKQVESTIHGERNRVRYTMNGFVIAVGGSVKPLLETAKATADSIGRVPVEMGMTSCKVPFAPDYIRKIESMGRIGRKKK